MPKEPMSKRSIRMPDRLWQAALERADQKGESLPEVIRRFVERYVR